MRKYFQIGMALIILLAGIPTLEVLTGEKTEREQVKYNLLKSPENWSNKGELPEVTQKEEIVEVSRYPKENYTRSDLRKAWKLYSETYEAAERNDWFNVSKGKEAGYKRVKGSHYPNREYLYDPSVLNPEKPEYLLYYNTSDGMKLAGVMYMEEKIGKHGEQVGGPFTVWHYHRYQDARCFESLVRITDRESSCNETELSETSPEMLHVWFTPRKNGQFATEMGVNLSKITTEKIRKKEFLKREKRALNRSN
ncbi:MAG: hypothetical protein ABEK10_02140 [Candidatus Nanosalina sp.]